MNTRSAVTTNLHAFMSTLIDYAGLFPPASLPLPEAIRNYARYRQSVDRWMLSRFIIPAVQLGELAAFADLFSADDPFAFSVLGRGGQEAEGFFATLDAEVKALEALRRQYATRVSVEIFEVKLPASITSSNDISKIVDLIAKSEALLNSARPIAAYYEVPFGPGWEQAVNATIEAIADYNAPHKHRAGFKLRCGGVEASAFPTPAQLALPLLPCPDPGIGPQTT